MRVVVGLGNPGCAYATTRHNVGFHVVEELTRRWHIVMGAIFQDRRTAGGTIAGIPVLMVEPQRYMNLSGIALSGMEPPITAADLIVIHDDIDLEIGRLRIKIGGGAGGHNGVQSIAEHFAADFVRVRVGIGRPPVGRETADHVLSAFDSHEQEVITLAVRRAADAVECILCEGENTAMNRFNTRPVAA